MLKLSEVRNAYMALWTHFETAASGAGFPAKSFYTNGALVKRANGTIEVDALLYLPQWPYKAVSAKEKIDILMQVKERFDENTSEIIGSTVQIGYFEIGQDQVLSLLQLHYDFELPVASAHPVFHAQLGTTKWDSESLQSLRFPTQLKYQESSAKLYSNVRIPTPHMGYVAALLALAADHLPLVNYQSFLTLLRSNASLKWEASSKSWHASFKQHGVASQAHHWY